ERNGSVASVLRQALAGLRDLKPVGDVRGIGLMWGVEFVADQDSKTPFPAEKNFSGLVAAAAVKRGVMVYPMQGSVDGIAGDHILVAPPAVIDHDQMEWAVGRLAEAIGEAGSQLAASGTR
ncbi:MAG TPA: hypothetical protein VJQ82_24135, partial [Terriglobales bacterium]|nr:hypothetical protein [Terriglobales bacterium]